MTLAILFDSVGVGEWFVLLAVVLIVVGPKNLPSTIRKFGNYYSKFRRAAESFKRQIMEMDTELNNIVKDAEKEVQDAVSIPESSPDGMDSPMDEDPYGREYDSADYSGPEYGDEDYYGPDGYPGEAGSDEEQPSGTAQNDNSAAAENAQELAGTDGGNTALNNGDKTTTAES